LRILDLLNLAGEDDGSQAYTLKKTIGPSYRVHTGHNTVGNITSVVANHEQNLKILLLD